MLFARWERVTNQTEEGKPMQDIIERVFEIDQKAQQAKHHHQVYMQSRKRYYEEQIETYRQKSLHEAEREGRAQYESIMQRAAYTHEQLDSEATIAQMDARYAQIEQEKLQAVFDDLLKVED